MRGVLTLTLLLSPVTSLPDLSAHKVAKPAPALSASEKRNPLVFSHSAGSRRGLTSNYFSDGDAGIFLDDQTCSSAQQLDIVVALNYLVEMMTSARHAIVYHREGQRPNPAAYFFDEAFMASPFSPVDLVVDRLSALLERDRIRPLSFNIVCGSIRCTDQSGGPNPTIVHTTVRNDIPSRFDGQSRYGIAVCDAFFEDQVPLPLFPCSTTTLSRDGRSAGNGNTWNRPSLLLGEVLTVISDGGLKPVVKGARKCHRLVADQNPVITAYYNLDSWVQFFVWADDLNYYGNLESNSGKGVCLENFRPDEQT